MKTYILTRTVFRRLETQFGDRLKCATCGKPLKENDVVISKPAGGYVVLRHKKCYDKMLIEVE